MYYRAGNGDVNAIRDISDYYMEHKCTCIGTNFLHLAATKNWEDNEIPLKFSDEN